mgnify:CR=1 FL=1
MPSTDQLADIYLKSTAYESLAKDLAREHTDSRREYYVLPPFTTLRWLGHHPFTHSHVHLCAFVPDRRGKT